ncbi:MAG: hypothetical protein ACYDD5_00640 [Sulfuricurvum sp.]
MPLLLNYWKELAFLVCILSFCVYVMYLRMENVRLSTELAVINAASKVMADEYAANIVEFEKKQVITEIVYKDRVKVIERRVDVNSSCEDVMASFDSYVY